MLYLCLLAYLAFGQAVPIPQVPGPMLYYPHPQFMRPGLHPFLHLNPAAKSIQGGHSPNDLFYYPTVPFPNSLLFRANQQAQPVQQSVQPAQPTKPSTPVQQEQATPANSQKFTPPPEGLVNAILAWFAENNIPLPEGPQKNEVFVQLKDQESSSQTEAESLEPKPKSNQRFYILNGQHASQYILPNVYPQQVVPQSVVPQVVMRSAIPDDQNVLFYQPQGELQQTNLKLRNGVQVQNQEVYPQNLVLIKKLPLPEQEERTSVRPIRYHGAELAKKTNKLPMRQSVISSLPAEFFLGESSNQEHQDPTQSTLSTMYQTQYVPVGVVPPQQYQEFGGFADPLSFINIPINRDVQIPNYIKGVPVRLDGNKKDEQNQQQVQQQLVFLQNNERNPEELKKIFYVQKDYLKPDVQSRFGPSEIQHEPSNEDTNDSQNDEDTEQQRDGRIEDRDPSADLAALDFVRYIASRHNSDQFSDSVVIDAKVEEANKEEDTEADAVVQADEPTDPTIAQAQPAGIALAGPGGVAATAPRATALAGEKGLAVSSPRATAVAGPKESTQSKPNKKQ